MLLMRRVICLERWQQCVCEQSVVTWCAVCVGLVKGVRGIILQASSAERLGVLAYVLQHLGGSQNYVPLSPKYAPHHPCTHVLHRLFTARVVCTSAAALLQSFSCLLLCCCHWYSSTWGGLSSHVHGYTCVQWPSSKHCMPRAMAL